VKVDVGGQGGGSSGGVDVAVNKPGHNVAVNVGGISEFLSQLGIHFNAKPSHHGSNGNVDVNVGGIHNELSFLFLVLILVVYKFPIDHSS
jgi:hypothetical protein